MIYLYDDFNYVIRLNKGEVLGQAIKTFATETKLEGAWLSGLGGALEATLGFFDINKKQYEWRTFKGLYEVTSLQGNLAIKDGEPVFHLHATLADASFAAIGGHVKDLVAAATLEIFVHQLQKPLNRVHDEEIGLPLLQL